jgi:hypothetical protein
VEVSLEKMVDNNTLLAPTIALGLNIGVIVTLELCVTRRCVFAVPPRAVDIPKVRSCNP